ncbi:hypothetical protein [Amycolatopsis sp. NPDC052450]|uniref:hypothetical protein n=1 Tax=Amycolatopsis sp. NPDC052450 TaxID=3363937 RepID=UPI0037CBB618
MTTDSKACIGCSSELGTDHRLPGWYHECARGKATADTLADDYRTLVELGGEAYERPLRPHEVADFQTENPGLDITGAYAEIEPTDDLGIARSYYYTVDDGNPDFVRVEKLQGGTLVSGADARKWVCE